MTLREQSRLSVLQWQSQSLLALALVPLIVAVGLDSAFFAGGRPLVPFGAFALGALLGLLVWKFRAATPPAAVTGGLIAAALYLATPGWRTALWPLIALLLLTLAATRFGRARKEKLGIAEDRRGRNAAQVAANLGAAALASIPVGFAHFFTLPRAFSANVMRLALAAALAEAAADTISSEFGEVLGGEPRLLTTLRLVSPGTDGAISVVGTIAGFIAAAIVAITASCALNLTPAKTSIVALAAAVGLFVDSFLGAVFERRGWLNNDAVNFLATLAAALLAVLLGGRS